MTKANPAPRCQYPNCNRALARRYAKWCAEHRKKWNKHRVSGKPKRAYTRKTESNPLPELVELVEQIEQQENERQAASNPPQPATHGNPRQPTATRLNAFVRNEYRYAMQFGRIYEVKHGNAGSLGLSRVMQFSRRNKKYKN